MKGKSHKRFGMNILKRVTSAVLVAVMLFTMVGIYIPAETFKAADQTVILAGNWGDFAGSNLESWNPTNTNAKMESKGNGYYYIKISFNETTTNINAAFKAILGTNGWSSPNIGGVDGNIDGDGNYVVNVPAGSTSIEIIADTTNNRLYNSIEHPDKIDVVFAGHKVTTHKMVILAGNFESFGSYPNWDATSTGLRMQEIGDGYYFTNLTFDASKSGQDAKFKAMIGGNGWGDPQIGGVSGNQDSDNNYVINVPSGNTNLVVIADTTNGKLYNSIQHSSDIANILKIYGKVELASQEILVEEGSSVQISAIIKPEGSAVKLTYTSGNTNIATVDQTGKVTGVSEGKTYIRVALDTNNYVDCQVEVSALPVVYEVDIEKDATTLMETESETLKVTFSPENTGLVWSSNDEKVATVDQSGKVTAVAPGTAIITASAPDGTKDTCTVTVTEKPTYTYTIYTYTSDSAHFSTTNSVFHIWDKESTPYLETNSNYAITGTEKLADGNTWLKTTITTKSKHFGFIFKEKHQGDTWGWKTGDYIFENTKGKDQTLYIVEGIDGVVFTELPAVKSPVIDGTKVTFTYYNGAGYSNLYLRGTFNSWGEEPMTKGENAFTLTKEFEPGVYEYKFWSGGDNWFADPLNASKTDDGNSKFIVTGFQDAQKEIEKGSGEVLPSTLQYVSASGTTTKATVNYALKETYEEGMVTLDNKTIIIAPSFEEDVIVLEVSATVGGQTVKGDYTLRLANKMFTYTIYAHSAMEARNTASAMGLWIWDAADQSLLKDQELVFTEVELNGQKWLKTTIETTAYKKLGLILKSKGGKDVWNWQTADIYFSNSSQTENVDIYLVDGYPTAYTSLSKVPQDRYVYVEYTKADGNYKDANVYAWNTGYVGKEDNKEVNYCYDFKNVNGKYIAKIPVVVGSAEKKIGFLVRTGYNTGDDWSNCVKDGGDNYVAIAEDQEYVKVRFQNGKVSYVLPEYVGSVIERKNNTINFYYRDDENFLNNTLGSLENVELYLRKKTGSTLENVYKYTMEYDAVNERYYYSLPLTEDTDYFYYYKVNGTTVLDSTAARTQVIEDVTYSLRRNKVYNINVVLDVTNNEMNKAGNKEMDYEDNAVLSVKWEPKTANDSLDGFYVEKAYADLSALGLGTKVEINRDLMELSFGCLDSIDPGSKLIKVTIVDDCGMSYTGTTIVTIMKREKTENTENKLGDFDWDEAVIYFAVTDRFFDGDSSNNPEYDGDSEDNGSLYHGGDLAGLTQKIDYLYKLGVNTIWITPIVDNIDQNVMPENDPNESYGYHGYWTSDFTKLNPHLGTEAQLKALIDAAHAKGMKIMVDVVLNHAGYGTEEYFNKIIEVAKDAEQNPIYKDMIRDTSNTVSGDEKMDSLSGLPDFVTEDADVRAKLIEWQTTWMSRFEIDYYRVDTVKHVDETTWVDFKNELTKINSEFKLIGEYYDAGFYNDYDQLDSGKMDSILDFHFNDVLFNLAGENMAAIEDALNERNTLLSNTATMGSFLSSHDENGFLYSLISDHKETGDWAAQLMKLAATYQITAKGQPVIYYGEEIGMTGENNYPMQDNRYDFDWDEQLRQEDDADSMYNHYKTMLKIRRDYSEVFAKGDRYSVVYPNVQEKHLEYTSQGYSVFARSYEDTTLYIGTNVWGEDKTVTFYVEGEVGSVYKDLYNNKTYTVAADGSITVTIPGLKDGNGTAVLVRSSGEKAEVEDTNTITLKLHYDRTKDDYDNGTEDTSDDWNAWVWGEGIKTEGFKFVEENGEMVATITINNARSASFASFRMRQGDWKANDHNAIDQSIDLSNVVSGTVHFYVKQGVWGGTTVLGSDAIVGTKIVNAKYDRNTNSAIITTNRPIAGNVSSAFNFMCVSDKKALTIKQVTENGCVYTVEFEENIAEMSEVIKSYTMTFDGYTYALNMPNIYTTEEFENAYTYDGKDLGLTYDKEAGKFTFKVWAPTADDVTLNIYKTGTKGDNTGKQSFAMTKAEKGVWEYTLSDDYHKYYYTYTVNVLNEQNEVCDPYARTTGVNGDRAMILDLDTTDPEGWAEDAKLNLHEGMKYTDAVIYELHVRDLSIHESSGVKDEYKGKFLGLTQTGTKTEGGATTALDHMIELGVTHLHLLPIYDYASVDESNLDKPQFNWGYDPLNYNVPEGSYSTDPYNGEVRVKEMKEMIMALHENNINVVMDVVYNHVYDAGSFSVNQIVPNYFSRTNEDGSFSNGSGCGNDTATERDMVHKFVVESILYWHNEYHIDGFRFDLVGLLDTVTINKIVEEVHKIDPDIIFYGEGWTLGTALSENKKDYLMATQQNAWATDEFAYFSDTLRNGVAGTDTNGEGFIWQKADKDGTIMECFLGNPWWCPDPLQTINYASCHDNYTLMDKINVVSGVSYADGYNYKPGEYQVKLNNLAAAVYMLSEGIPLIHAGEDFLRIKLDENNTVIHNSYNASDYVNQMRWYNLDEKLYKETFEYYKGLIEFRKNHAALRLELASEVSKVVTSKWVDTNLLMFKLDGSKVADEVADEIIIVYNATNEEKYVNIKNDIGASDGTWHVCIDGNKAGKESLYTVNVNDNYSWPKVAAHSTLVLVKGATEDNDSVYTRNNNVTISLDKTTLELKANSSATLEATVNPKNSTLIWTSSNENVAKVDANGTVTAVGVGTATITVSTLHGVSATCAVTVKELTGVGLNKVNLTLKENETETLVATTNPAGSTVTWSSSDETVATVDSTGKVTAVGAGTAIITVTMTNGEKENCEVTVIHTLTEVAAKEPTTTTTGNIKYYVCNACGKLFLDEEATQPTTLADVTLDKLPVEPENPPVAPEDPVVPPVDPEDPVVPPVDPEDPVIPPVEKEDVVYVPEEEVHEQVKDEAGKLTDMIENNELEEGIVSEETLEKVQEALDNDEEIITELVIENLKEVEVEEATKELVESALKEIVKDIVSEIAQYLDIKVVLKTEGTGEELGTLNKLSKEITLTFEIPEEWKKEGRIFNVIRVHEGKTDVLDVWENADGTVSFKTDRFSTYALVYTDVEEEGDTTPTPPVDPEDPVVPPVTPEDPVTPPVTGDNSMPGVYVLVLLAGLAMAAAGIMVSKRKYVK